MLIPGKNKDKVVDEAAVEKFINSRPNKKEKKDDPDMRIVTFKMDSKLLKKIDQAANKIGISRSSFIKSALSSVMDNGLNIRIGQYDS